MIHLTDQQTEQVLHYVKSAVGHSPRVLDELFDHWCCFIEGRMASGVSFDQAFDEMNDHFDTEEVRQIEQHFMTCHPDLPWLRTFRRVGSMAAMLILMVVAGVDAQRRPDISPLFDEHPITSRFGDRTHPITQEALHHNGIDIKVDINTPVRSTADGTVTKVYNDPKGHGLYIIISHNDGYETLYANLSSANVYAEQTVVKGEIIGLTGNSGISTAPHLHYEIRQNQNPVNPEIFISK